MKRFFVAILLTSGCSIAFPVHLRGGDVDNGGGAEDGGLAIADASGRSFCASREPKPLFCDDFDSDDPISARWSPAAGASLDPSLFRSPPRSLSSGLEPSPTCSFAQVGKEFAGPYHAARLGFSVQYDDAAFSSGYVASLQLVDGEAKCNLIASVGNGELAVLEQLQTTSDGANAHHRAYGAVPAKTWTRVEVDVDYTLRRLRAVVEGRTVIDEALSLACPLTTGSVQIGVGLYCDSGGPGRHLNIDDVTFDGL